MVLGLNGSPGGKDFLIEKFNPDHIVKWQDYHWGMHKPYSKVVGHSMGSMVIQADPTCPSKKIITVGSPKHIRGEKYSGFIWGHLEYKL